MMRTIFIIILILCSFILGAWVQSTANILGFTQSNIVEDGTYNIQAEKRQIIDTLTRQSAAWSAGDIDAFMRDYWKSEELRFASGGTVKRGWQTTSDRYKARYPDKATMGSLAFSDLEVDVLSAQHALIFGRWTLTRDGDAPTGLFTLHMKKQGDTWKIVSDHTSSGTP